MCFVDTTTEVETVREEDEGVSSQPYSIGVSNRREM